MGIWLSECALPLNYDINHSSRTLFIIRSVLLIYLSSYRFFFHSRFVNCGYLRFLITILSGVLAMLFLDIVWVWGWIFIMVSSMNQFDCHVKELLWHKEKWETNFLKGIGTAMNPDDVETLRINLVSLLRSFASGRIQLCTWLTDTDAGCSGHLRELSWFVSPPFAQRKTSFALRLTFLFA